MHSDQSKGRGSTIVLLDLYGCDPAIAGNPTVLHEALHQIVLEHSLTPRAESLDIWDSLHQGPSTSYFTLAESHARAEAWTEDEHNMHVNADFQVCNYSKVNTQLPVQMAEAFARKLKATSGSIMIIQRGPGVMMSVLESPRPLNLKKVAA